MRRHRMPEQLPDVFLGSAAVAAGLLTPAQLRGPHVVRVLQGVYRPAWVVATHELACRGAALVVPPEARLTGRSLATVCGVPLARSGDRVEVVVPHGVELRRGGIATRRASSGPLGQRTWSGVRTAHAHRMAFDLAARWDLPTGVAHLDAVIAAGLADRDGLSAWLEQRHDDDVRRVRRACELVDPRAGSLPESRLRVVLVQAGVVVAVQHEVWHAGRFVARTDLAVPELRVAIEYDGAWHALRSQLAQDRARLNALQAAGWVVVHVTADMMRDPAQVVAVVRAALAAAAARR